MKAQDFILSPWLVYPFSKCKPRGLLIINWILSSKNKPTNSFLQQFEKKKKITKYGEAI
jgi:hypothetical protein